MTSSRDKKIKKLEKKAAAIAENLAYWGFAYSTWYKEKQLRKLDNLYHRIENERG